MRIRAPRPGLSGGGAAALLGIDIGTSSCKAVLVDLEGRERAIGRVITPWRRRGATTEANPIELKAAALAAVAEARRTAPDTRVIAVGVASMAETGVCSSIDGASSSLRRSQAWRGRG